MNAWAPHDNLHPWPRSGRGYDPEAGSHVYLRGADPAFSCSTIVHVGGRCAGPVEIEMSGRDGCAMPGLITMHTHPSNQPSFRGREDLGNPNFHPSGVYDGRTAFVADAGARRWDGSMACWEMLRFGVTTIVDMSFPDPGRVEAIGGSGLRRAVFH